MVAPEPLGKEIEHEIERFRWALDLEEGFAFHLIVADSPDALDTALLRLPESLWILRPRLPKDFSDEQAAALILAELDRVIEASDASPVLLDAMMAENQPAWATAFRRLNELRNGLERRHGAPLIVAVSPTGESFLGREAPDLWSRRGSGMRLHDPLARRQVDVAVEHFQPPVEPAAFESLCFDLFKEIWNDSGAQKRVRSSQPRAGVDIFGQSGDQLIGVRCENHDGPHGARDLARAVEQALEFKPGLARFIIATRGPANAMAQQRAGDISARHGRRGLFSVEVWSWADIWREINAREELLRRFSSIYWPRSAEQEGKRIAPTRLAHAGERLVGRGNELARLDTAWADPGTHIVILVAWGGVGKTSLVARWTAALAAREYDGADYFDWSFYSQGTRETGGPSSDAFVTTALRFFGDAEMARSFAPAWDKGARLAQLVARRRTLLVLDGLEPLQHPPGPLAGRLKDPAIIALLKGLAVNNPGLCVVTTRERVADLASFRDTTAPEWKLGSLSTAGGVELLRTVGVHGPAAELARLVQDIHGHALTLNLLGRYLANAHGGDVRRRDRVELKNADLRTQGGYAFDTIAANEAWLAEGGPAGLRQLAILKLLGLFDRPAAAGSLAALRCKPVIVGLTEPLANLDDSDWNHTVAALVDSGLVFPSGDSSLDTHPLIREYFAHQLHEHNFVAWCDAHGRLFEHLQEVTAYRPDTLEGLQPLYQAVAHGCHAERHRDALDVYWNRILRGNEHYSTNKLGVFGVDLSVVACFFESPWSRVSPSLPQADQVWLLNAAAFRLRALGRLTEAMEPMRAGLQMGVEQENWKQAAIIASNLSELQLTLGGVPGAVRDAEQAVVFADRSGDALQRMVNRTTLADALHQAGRRVDASAFFREAEEMQAERQPGYPLLYSSAGFKYYDLLLADAERAAWKATIRAAARGKSREAATVPSGLVKTYGEVEQRAARALNKSEEYHELSILEFALDHLALGRARLYKVILERLDPLDVLVESEIQQAMDGFRRAGQLDDLPHGLLTRAWLRFWMGDSDGARADLDEAVEIAERGPMPLFQADALLYRARLFRDKDTLAEARRLIEKHGYGRRLGELGDAEAVLSPVESSFSTAKQKRFKVALCFPAEYRAFVEEVAEILADQVGRDHVFYDRYFETELARPDFDTYLQHLYHDESELIAVFLSADYERQNWSGLEWRNIRDLISKRQGSAVMPFRFEETEVPGLFSTDGYVWIGNRRSEEVAALIIQRLALNIGGPTRAASADPSLSAKPTPSAKPTVALKVWQEKLDFLLSEKAKVIDAEQKFRLMKLITEAKEKIREHRGPVEQ